MYKVILYDNPYEQNGIDIHSPRVNDLKVEGTFNKEINKIDRFDITIYPHNPGFGKFRELQSFITIINTKTNQKDFKGRVFSPSDTMDAQGLNASYVCEGELGYLHDSVQQHLEFRGTTREAFKTILDYHNSQVEDYKRFEVGQVEVQDPNDYMYFYLNATQKTFDAMFEKLIDKLGGELQIRYENGVRYLDWLRRIGHDSDTEIHLKSNLQSISRKVDTSEIVTRLTPLGERIESEDEDATDASQERLTIKSVNNGVPYIDRPDLIEIFGIQGESEVWDDVTTPQRLLTSGRNWLNNQKEVLYQYTIEALDLSLIGQAIDSFETGNTYPVKNPVMGIDERLRVVATTIDINSPENSNLTIGDKFKRGTEYQVDAQRASKRVVELENEVNYERIRGNRIRQELTQKTNELQQIVDELDTSQIPVIEAALLDINQSIGNLQTSIGEIPVYTLATANNDGLMSKEDKQKLDTLIIPDYTEEFNQINIQFVDLVQRIEALEGDGE